MNVRAKLIKKKKKKMVFKVFTSFIKTQKSVSVLRNMINFSLKFLQKSTSKSFKLL